MRVERSFRGISRRLAVHYLTNLGGEEVDTGHVVGDGWEATLSESKATVGPTLSLNEVEVVFEGDDETLETLVERFAQKAMRAGG
ncbi:hypothetical protein [Salinigranum salinum]|jgi:hypothetical protein|uniref:hypothetical protein n=1 Tax=Salinigranum salinum TaxID=1364937 RepID=UPI0012607A16|nr:hypothetical protein [Salinigranum salinum]